jgi:hypothetical protein
MESSSFQLSRIFARGWSAGRKCDAEDISAIEALGDSLNPCKTPAERMRWLQGFTESAVRNLAKQEKPRHHP